MHRRHTRMAAALAAIVAGGLAAFSLRPAQHPVATLAARQPVEVRTQVIRRTVHIVRHEHPTHPGPRGAVAAGGPGRAKGGTGVRTGASGSHGGASGASANSVATRTSGSTGVPVASSGTGSVTTRTSGTHTSSGSGSSGGTVTTRTSGTRGSSGGSGGGTVTTRSSGGGHGERGDGGDGGGGGGGDN